MHMQYIWTDMLVCAAETNATPTGICSDHLFNEFNIMCASQGYLHVKQAHDPNANVAKQLVLNLYKQLASHGRIAHLSPWAHEGSLLSCAVMALKCNIPTAVKMQAQPIHVRITGQVNVLGR